MYRQKPNSNSYVRPRVYIAFPRQVYQQDFECSNPWKKSTDIPKSPCWFSMGENYTSVSIGWVGRNDHVIQADVV